MKSMAFYVPEPAKAAAAGVQFETQRASLHLFDASLPAEQETWRTWSWFLLV